MKAFFAIAFLAVVIVIVINFKSLLPQPSVEPVFPGLSGQFYTAIRSQNTAGQMDPRFFRSSKIKISDHRANKKDILDLKVLSQAFRGSAANPEFEIQIDVFESNDAEGKTATKAIFQMDLFDSKTKNKIAEFALML